MLCFCFKNSLLSLIKILTSAQFSGADRHKLFCPGTYISTLVGLLRDGRGQILPLSCLFANNSLTENPIENFVGILLHIISKLLGP